MTWRGPTLPGFGPEPAGDFYRYAPAIVETQPGLRHVYLCGNVENGVIRDHVVHRVATRSADGTWVLGPEDIVLGPSDEAASATTTASAGCGGFDCYHTCDPELLAGSFQWDGASFEYALFYTGNDFAGSTHNAIGVAFAHSPEGPFVRATTPLVPYGCGDKAPWSDGMMQPSVVSIDGAGRFFLFTRNDCGRAAVPSVREALYVVDLSQATASVSAPTYIGAAGLTGYGGAPDVTLINADWAYDLGRDRWFVVRHQHPLPPPPTTGNPLPYSVQVATLEGAVIRGESPGSWQPLGDIAPADDGGNTWVTHADRNHNAGFVRDPLGHLVEAAGLEVGYTSCDVATALYGRTVHTIAADLRASFR
ncbi:MAG: hypothetical protein ABI321_06870 [Polyangia bacterium]